jgi:hypothetical protein
LSNFLLANPLIARLRRNHALEHATIHILSRRHRNVKLVGRSNFNGFRIYGNMPAGEVERAAREALHLLKAGQRELAVHPTCGTNFVAGGILAGLGAFAVLTPRRRSFGEWMSRLPTVLLVATLGLIFGQRLGGMLQARVTTDPLVGNMEIIDVTREELGPLLLHTVRTGG